MNEEYMHWVDLKMFFQIYKHKECVLVYNLYESI